MTSRRLIVIPPSINGQKVSKGKEDNSKLGEEVKVKVKVGDMGQRTKNGHEETGEG